MNKTKAVYEYLMTGASITLKDSVAMFNLYALSQTLTPLKRNKGIPIESIREKSANGAWYSRYWLNRDYIAKVKSGEVEGLFDLNKPPYQKDNHDDQRLLDYLG